MSEITLYTAWFCPYAQRAWLACNLYEVPYKHVEAIGLDEPQINYVKDPEFLKVNPRGMVPTLDVTARAGETAEGGRNLITESLQALTWLRDAMGKKELVEGAEAAAVKLNEMVSSGYYRVLVRNEPELRVEGWARMQEGLEWFVSSITDGFWGGASSPGTADLAVYPWVHRLFILSEYRGVDLDTSLPWVQALNTWRARMDAVPAVKATLADPAKLLASYKRYRDNTVKSRVGDAVMSGGEAHAHA